VSQQQGRITENLMNVIRSIQRDGITGELRVGRGEGAQMEYGSITFINGQVVSAQLGSYTGVTAFNILATWGRCLFVFGQSAPASTSLPSSSNWPNQSASGGVRPGNAGHGIVPSQGNSNAPRQDVSWPGNPRIAPEQSNVNRPNQHTSSVSWPGAGNPASGPGITPPAQSNPGWLKQPVSNASWPGNQNPDYQNSSSPGLDRQNQDTPLPSEALSPLRRSGPVPAVRPPSTNPGMPVPIPLTAIPRATMSVVKAVGAIERAGLPRSYRQLILKIDGRNTINDLIGLAGHPPEALDQMLHDLENMMIIRIPR